MHENYLKANATIKFLINLAIITTILNSKLIMKNTLILGASVKPERYAYKATIMLSEKEHEVFPVGLREGKIGEHDILTNKPLIENISYYNAKEYFNLNNA